MCGPEEPPGVEGAERSEGGGGNWGGPPRPGGCGEASEGWRPITGGGPGSGRGAGRAWEAAVVPLEPTGQQNPRRWEGPLLRLRVACRERLASAVHGYDRRAR